MSPLTPITLMGDNLGDRHREFNALVSEAIKLGDPVADIQELPEKSALDRIFKIDLASKHKHVQYIIKNLKDTDMLYVSRALKAKWLLEEQYKEIINPVSLEEDVYPDMILTAVNKMRHWIQLNLQDERRCAEFYFYYCDKDLKLAMKYLLKCSVNVINQEIKRFFKDDSNLSFSLPPQYYITPHYFKMFCERSPLVAKLVYDMVGEEANKSFRLYFINRQGKYFEGLKCILKSDPDIFLDVIEKYFNADRLRPLSPSATRFILTHKYERFVRKPELYASCILDMKELAKSLNSTESEELVTLLARSKFLESWFDYKNVEPLFKRIDEKNRAVLKDRVFVLKVVGEVVKHWPYPPPGNITEKCVVESIISDDSDEDVNEQSHDKLNQCLAALTFLTENRKTLIKYSDVYHDFCQKSFMESLFELSTMILTEYCPQNRMHIMLLLVSKIGGKEENLEATSHFLLKYRNEPPHVRAAVMRSLVKRVSIWRASDDVWDRLLAFGQNVCLTGSTSEAECKEGLHAVVIRNLLKTSELPSEIMSLYLKNFSTLTQYPLSVTEKKHILDVLPKILLESANNETDGETVANYMTYLLNTMKVAAVQPSKYDEVIPAVRKLLEKDEASGKRILKILFNSKIGRKHFFKENFANVQSDDSYVNALKHDMTVLSVHRLVNMIVIYGIHLDRFLRNTRIYFAEDGGLAMSLLDVMKKEKTHINLARPIAFLIGSNLKTYISKMDVKREVNKEDKDLMKFCAQIRANAHVARPVFDIDAITWRQAGVKLIANKILICKSVDVNKYIEQSILWKRSAKLALFLAMRSDRTIEVFKVVTTMRPTMAIKVAFDYIKRDQSTLGIWETIKPLLPNLDLETKNAHLMRKIVNLNQIPDSIRADFIQKMYPLYLNKKSKYMTKPMKALNYNRVLQHIHNIVPEMEPKFIENLLLNFLQNEFTKGKLQYPVYCQNGIYNDTDMHLRILAKFLLICKNEDEQDERFARLGDLFFDILEDERHKSIIKKTHNHYMKTFLQALKYDSVFFSNEYLSCVHVMQKILKRMHSQLPMEEFFLLYVEIHLSMLYYSSVKKTVIDWPELFGKELNQKKNKEGMEKVAHAFGKSIAREAKTLISTYFESVIDLYSQGLKDYLHRFKESNHELSLHLVKGIIEASEGLEGRLAIDIYFQYRKKNKDWVEVRKSMAEKFDEQTMSFFYSEK